MSEEVRAGEMTLEEFLEAESCMHRSPRPLHDDGHGLDDGLMVEALGIGLPGNAAYPGRRRAGATCSRAWPAGASSSMVHEDLMLSKILTREAFENAIRVNAGDRRLDQRRHPPARDRRPHRRRPRRSTTGTASAASVPLPRRTCMPSGQYLMEDFYYAGGLPVGDAASSASTAAAPGRADRQRQDDLGEHRGRAELEPRRHHAARRRRSRRKAASPCCAATSRPTARSSSRRRRRPPDAAHAAARSCSRTSRTSTRASTTRALDIDETCVMVLKNCGPKGYPGHGRGRQHAAAAQAAEAGRHRHGAHLATRA